MPPVVKFFLSLVAIALFLAASPFLLEAGVRAYDHAFDPYVRPDALSADGRAAVSGQNRRLFRENRFSVRSPRPRLELLGLTEDQAVHAATPVRGRVAVYDLGSVTNAVPGAGPPEGTPRLLAFPFRLETVRTRPSADARPSLVVAATSLDTEEERRLADSGPDTFDVLCDIVPAGPGEGFAALDGRMMLMQIPVCAAIELICLAAATLTYLISKK